MNRLKITAIHDFTQNLDWVFKTTNNFLDKHDCGWEIEWESVPPNGSPLLTGPEDERVIAHTWIKGHSDDYCVLLMDFEDYAALDANIKRVYGNAGRNTALVNITDKYVYWDNDEKFTRELSKAKDYDLWLPQPCWSLLHELCHSFFPEYSSNQVHSMIDDGSLIDLLKLINNKLSMPEYLIIHHTGTPRDTTQVTAIIKNHQKEYGRAYYQCFIQANGNVIWNHNETNKRAGGRSIDYCVVGDFTKEIPTREQLTALDKLIGDREYLGHREATTYGATPSECPGNLLDQLESFRKPNRVDALKKLAFMVAERIGSKRIPKDLGIELLLLLLTKIRNETRRI